MASEETAGSDDIADGDGQTTSGTEEFGLQVLPVESEVIASTESQEAPGIDQANEARKSQDELLDTFSMQGFSTRIKYMDAYLLELQDENQLLKDKVDSLEKTVGLLVNFVPIDGLSPEQQAALENLRDDFSSSEIMGSEAEEDAADEISVNTTVDSELAAISTTDRKSTRLNSSH